ncbi:MAG: hypothetical protein JXB32_02790 [Deltaproteobacteria bacterium]|nr:hypothetical protein [Deltaproteobacteria bacterium]
MTAADHDDQGAIEVAERILLLIDRGRFTSTYKYAVLMGLMDLCLERAARDGSAPQSVTTRQLAERIVELYWPHTAPFPAPRTADRTAAPPVLRQNSGGQAEILTLIRKFRTRHAPEAATAQAAGRKASRTAFERLVRNVEWKLVEMPLPKLQRLGDGDSMELLYRINWDDRVRRRDLAGEFDNQIRFVGRAGEHLVPWVRHPNDDIENLVTSDARCNNDKRDFLAAVDQIRRWTERNTRRASELRSVADQLGWRSDGDRSVAVARAVCLHLPPGSHLWLGPRSRFEPLDHGAVRAAFAVLAGQIIRQADRPPPKERPKERPRAGVAGESKVERALRSANRRASLPEELGGHDEDHRRNPDRCGVRSGLR